jgi:hypothetical protein
MVLHECELQGNGTLKDGGFPRPPTPSARPSSLAPTRAAESRLVRWDGERDLAFGNVLPFLKKIKNRGAGGGEGPTRE